MSLLGKQTLLYLLEFLLARLLFYLRRWVISFLFLAKDFKHFSSVMASDSSLLASVSTLKWAPATEIGHHWCRPSLFLPYRRNIRVGYRFDISPRVSQIGACQAWFGWSTVFWCLILSCWQLAEKWSGLPSLITTLSLSLSLSLSAHVIFLITEGEKKVAWWEHWSEGQKDGLWSHQE